MVENKKETPNSCHFGSWQEEVRECRCFIIQEISKKVNELFGEEIRFADRSSSELCPFMNNYKDYKAREENKQNECPSFIPSEEKKRRRFEKYVKIYEDGNKSKFQSQFFFGGK